MAKRDKVESGRSGASAVVKGTKVKTFTKFKEPKAPKGWSVPAISVRSGKEESTVYSKPSSTGQTWLTKQKNSRYIKTKLKKV